MASKTLKIISLALLGSTMLYVYKSWESHKERSSFDVKDIKLSQVKLDISELHTKFKEPVWCVNTESSMVCFCITFKNEGGRSFADRPGILNVMINSLLDGAGTRDSTELKKFLDTHSINVWCPPDNDDLCIEVACLAKYFDIAIDVLCDVLSAAHLKEEKIEIIKQNCVASVKQSMFSTDTVAAEKLNHMMYEDGHPYNKTNEEMLARIPKYTRKDVVECYNAVFDPRHAAITIVSSLPKENILRAFNKVFDSIKDRKNNFGPVRQQTELRTAGKEEYVELNNPQSTVLFALPGVLRSSKEKYAVRAANDIWGAAGLVSRLARTVRDQSGLVYRIRSDVYSEDLQSHIRGSSSTRPENVQQVIECIKKECKELYEHGITEEELRKFKVVTHAGTILNSSYTILSFVTSERSDGVKMNDVNEGLSNYYNLTVDDVNKAAKKFDPSKLIFVVCGKTASPGEKPAKLEGESIEMEGGAR
ncbi:MAG: insulinase family protein [Holosporales bacterium]|jgi:zinc protease|nr:insulinase family protein [Holosporales bacterium]